MGSRGFVFSLDAFVAFTLIMIVVGLLVFTIGTPKPFYPSLQQAHQLAYDTLNVLATSTDAPGNPTYLEQLLGASGTLSKRDIMVQVVGGVDPDYRPIIPQGYGYALKAYDLTNNPNHEWATIFESNSSTDCQYTGRCQKQYTKLQASASTFASIYNSVPNPGLSPFCYLGCHGYYQTAGQVTADPCITVPCDIVPLYFDIGNNSIQIIELVVYT